MERDGRSGESYARGAWQCDDLTSLIRLFVLNRHLIDGMERDSRRFSAPSFKAAHRLHRNTKQGTLRTSPSITISATSSSL